MTGKQIVALIVFLGFFTLFSSDLSVNASKLTSLSNQTNENLTIIGGTGATVVDIQLCDFDGGEIPLGLGGFLWGLDCIVDHVAVLFGFAGVSSGVAWVQIIIIGMVMALIYVAVRLIRGGG